MAMMSMMQTMMPMMQKMMPMMQGGMMQGGMMQGMPMDTANMSTKAYTEAMKKMDGPMMQGVQAADPDIACHAGQVLHVADLARAYGFTDADGSQPDRFSLQS